MTITVKTFDNQLNFYHNCTPIQVIEFLNEKGLKQVHATPTDLTTFQIV